MLKIKVNDTYTFEVESKPDGMLLNGELFDWDIKAISHNQFHILYRNQSYTAEVVKADHASKAFTLKINGKLLQVQAKDRFDQLLEQMGMSNNGAVQVKEIKAPMPGLILAILVADGQEVKKGDPVMILEAMKMENIIKSPADGVVKTVKVNKGQSVEKNQVLVIF